MEQALALLANSQLATHLLGLVSNIYLQAGLRPDLHGHHHAAPTNATPYYQHPAQMSHPQPQQHNHHLNPIGQNISQNISQPANSMLLSTIPPSHQSQQQIPPQQPQNQAPSQQQQQTTQPPPLSMPFYPFEQVITLLSNSPVAANLFHVLNLYFQGGLRPEAHGPHHPHNPPHYQHHMHAPHPQHNHHGQNGQTNGQDDTMLTLSESKPRGLTRAEIDSLTPYIQMNEKDSRSCVICLSKFELKSKIRPLSCEHVFHAKCVDKWLRANRTCPICRRDALKTYPAKLKRI